ncbi:MAG: bifunctional 4-hydroxy-3-methylbut-2-enyl diphosphate reductase/30S ribosomal protein S1 [Syntrophomonas sp.]|nr:bifunctional 4-hydroxy-3-methylbut-2-enyl diphosphate reductase/30S ribosomal protein S1 [Syntrophomonas sp.]
MDSKQAELWSGCSYLQTILANKAGFCAGVRRAFQMTEEAGRDGYSWSTLGPLVHNDEVVQYFANSGIPPVDRLEEIQTAGIIIRTHGVPPDIMAQATALGIQIKDATCPLVARIHEAAQLLIQEDYDIIIFGDTEHPEVKGILGFCQERATVIADADQARVWRGGRKLGLISQTTKDESQFYEVAAVLLPSATEIRVINTICSATRQRQAAARELAQRVDLMLVIGDRNSSNTKTLTMECQKTGVRTWQIQSAADIYPEALTGVDKVGITAGASTPDWIIKEVLDRMMEFGDGAPQEQQEVKPAIENESQETGENAKEENFARMEAEMADLAMPNKGDIVKGIVIQVLDDEVMVDVGGKSEGIIPLREMTTKDANSAKDLVKIGDELEVLVLRWDDDGTILLSKKKVDSKRAMDKLEEDFNAGNMVDGTITGSVKGGLLVDVGVVAFLPASHVEDGYVKNLEDYIGKAYKFNIIEFNRHKKRGSQIVVSRKKLVEEERARQKEEFWASIQEGQTVRGRIKRIVDYGVFIDLGGFEGLLHVSEMDHVRISHPADVVKEGEEIDVYILGLDRDKQRVSLSRKKLLKSPWEIVLEKYSEGDIVDGKVVRIAPFGAFVEIEPGVDGLVHISQLANRRVEKPQDVVSVDQMIKVKILSIDPQEKRIGLSIREVAQDLDDIEVQEYLEQQEQPEQEQELISEDAGGVSAQLQESPEAESPDQE